MDSQFKLNVAEMISLMVYLSIFYGSKFIHSFRLFCKQTSVSNKFGKGQEKTGKVVEGSKIHDWNIPQVERVTGNKWQYQD